MSRSLTGNDWTRRFRFYDYDSTGEVTVESTCRQVEDVKRLFLDADADRASLKIKYLRAFATDLGTVRNHPWIPRLFSWIYDIFRGSLKHHFLEIELASGKIVSAEKTTSYLLFQSCSAPATPDTPPAVRLFTEGKPRQPEEAEREDSLLHIVSDEDPKDYDLLDVLEWIHARRLLEETYHVSDANCQHFVGLLWSQLSGKPYPSPRQFNGNIEPMRRRSEQAPAETSKL